MLASLPRSLAAVLSKGCAAERHLPALLSPLLRTAWSASASALPGSSLRIDAADSQVSCKASMGASSVELQADVGWVLESSPSTIGSTGSSRIRVSQPERQAAGSAGPLQVLMPDKWLSLDIRTHGQDVSVAKMVEADLRLETQGGGVTLGQVRAMTATIDTCNADRTLHGPLSGGELSGSAVHVSTGAAPVTLKRLVGQRVILMSQGAAFNAGAVYGEDVSISTGGGRIVVRNMDCSAAARLDSGGADVQIDCLEGHAHVSTAGGTIQAHIHQRVGRVRLDSRGGPVRVAISPDVDVCITVEDAGTCSCSAGPLTPNDQGHPFIHVKPTSGQPAQQRSGPSAGGLVTIAAGRGAVEISVEDWAAAMRRRFSRPS